MHTQKLAEVFADGGTKKKHAGEKVQKCLKSKQKLKGTATHHRQRQLSSPSAVGEAELSG